jgi:multimeric flavodoxin WrbA
VKALVLYDSIGGNTEKVAERIRGILRGRGLEADLSKVASDMKLDFLQYDLVFIGSPVQAWLPTETLMQFLKRILREYHEAGEIPPCTPLRPGKFGVCFATYAGPHTGVGEAIPTTKWVRAFLEHLGYLVLDEWHVLGEFRDRDDLSTLGRHGDIRGRPNQQDLEAIALQVTSLLTRLKAWQEEG